MNETTQIFAVSDPKEFDGNPNEVAGRACQQASGVARVLAKAIKDAEPMVQNSQLTRNLQETPKDARAAEWSSTLLAQKLRAAAELAEDLERTMAQLAQAASFDPKAPLPKD